jgi:outer membrane protein
MLAARAATSSAEAQAEQVRSPLWPQFTGTASYMRETGNFVPRPGVAVPGPTGYDVGRTFDFWTFGLSGSQLLWDFGFTSDKYRAARYGADAQRVTEQTTRVQVVLGVRRAYFNAGAMKELVDVARQTLDAQNRHLVQVQGFVTVGTQPQIALAQQRASVANARVQLITAENNYETAKATLNQAAGFTDGTDYDIADEELPPQKEEELPLDTLVAKALVERPEMAALDKEREVQQATLDSARGGYGPSLSAQVGATEQGTTLTGLVPNWNAGFVATWQFFQGGLTKSQVHQAEAGLRTVEAQRAIEELQVRLDVNSAQLTVRAAKATIGAAQDAADNAREQLRLAEQRFTTGVGNIIELTDAQVAFTSAAAQVVQARYGLASARAQLLAALGRT